MPRSPDVLPATTRPPASIQTLREAVADLSSRGAREVDAVRRAFTSGIVPVQTASSGSKADFINRFAGAAVPAAIVRSTAQFGLSTSIVTTPPSSPRPELDFVEVGVDRTFGVLDSFFARVVFSLPLDQLARVSYFRVLRAPTGPLDVSKPAFSALAESIPLSFRAKSSETVSNAALRLLGTGVPNKLSDFVSDDRFSSQRNVLSGSSMRPVPPSVNTNRRMAPAGLVSIANGDRSVLENVAFYVNQRNVTATQRTALPLRAGKRQYVNVLRGQSVGSSTAIVSDGNSLGFSEVTRVSTVPARRVGAIAEFEYFDPSVVYGAGYVYYVVAVPKLGIAGARSRLAVVGITRDSPPRTPNVLYGVSRVPRFVMRTSGSFIDHFEVFRRGGSPPDDVRLISTNRSMIDSGKTSVMDSGFYHVGDVGVGADKSAIFVDDRATPGIRLDYRIYAVDSFGLKSQTAFSCSVLLPDPGRTVLLGLPAVTAEQAPGGRIVNVTITCDDQRVQGLIVKRRDVSINENGFRQPTRPDYFTFGVFGPKRSRARLGPSLNQFSSQAWNGVIQGFSGSATFTDRSVQFDRAYQYAVVGVDARGNETATVPTQPVFVAVKPVADAPTSVTGTLLGDPSGSPESVLVQWTVGTVDFSPVELIDDQDVLAATSVRSVFQVERRQVGKSAWLVMPPTTASYFIDPVGGRPAPRFRPPFALPNERYDYRVIAMQSGAFLSTHTDPVRVNVVPEILPPPALVVRSSSTAVRPLRIVVSWDYRGIFVDGWAVQRAVTNRIFGSRIFSMDSAEARSLEYSDVGTVRRESSLALGISSGQSSLDSRLFVGNRVFIDSDVSMANSYFYRVRAMDSTDRSSDWTYGGISLTDSPFDRKFLSSLSDDDRARLSLDARPLAGWEDE